MANQDDGKECARRDIKRLGLDQAKALNGPRKDDRRETVAFWQGYFAELDRVRKER